MSKTKCGHPASLIRTYTRGNGETVIACLHCRRAQANARNERIRLQKNAFKNWISSPPPDVA